MAGRLARSFDPLVRSWEHSAADDFHLHDFQAAMLPSTVWYPRYDRILYIGGTLKIGLIDTISLSGLALKQHLLK